MRNPDGTITVPPDFWIDTDAETLRSMLHPEWVDFWHRDPTERQAFVESVQAELARREGLCGVRTLHFDSSPAQRPRTST